MMKLLHCLRAKSKNISEGNLLLKDHISETIKRAVELKKFYEINLNNFEYSELNDNFFKTLIQTIFIHDLGKIDYYFQKKLYTNDEDSSEELKLLQQYLYKPGLPKIEDHEVISVIYSFIFDIKDKDKMERLRSAVLLHHYNGFYNNNEISFNNIKRNYPEIIPYFNFINENKEKIEELFTELKKEIVNSIKNDFVTSALDELKIDFSKLDNISKPFNKNEIFSMYKIPYDKTDYEFLFLLGCLRRCDYSASGEVAIEQTESLSNIYEGASQIINKKFGSKLWQPSYLSKIDAKNLILVAPTGSGKTEFALLWASKRGKKLIYTLPLRVALNDLYSRFTKNDYRGHNEPYFNNENVSILHSTSFIEYIKEERGTKNVSIEDKINSSKVFSYPILLTTVDQAFLSSLKYYGFDKLISIYPFSCFVIDEIQAYTPEMMAIIIKTIKMIQKMNGNILIMTATFPPYLNELFDDFAKEDVSNYDEKEKIKNYSLSRHKVKVIKELLFNDSQQKKKTFSFNENGKVELDKILEETNNSTLIVVNNVSKAIELYDYLKDYFKKNKTKNYDVFLLHSRIVEKVKRERISEIKEKLKNNEKIILVATQVVEASVDVDFDTLITEISPIESQIQRWGRIWRNKNEDYSSAQPNVYVFCGKIDNGAEAKLDRGTTIIYDREITLKTAEVLSKHADNNLLNYESEKMLIKEVYDEKTLKEYKNKIEKNLEWLEYWSAEKKSDAQRVFRMMGGIQVFIPALLKIGNEGEQIFFEVLNEIRSEEGYKNESWKNITDKVMSKIQNLEKNKLNKLKKSAPEMLENNERNLMFVLKKMIYENSVNIPFFTKDVFYLKEFKGIYILEQVEDGRLKDIIEKGINNLKDTDIEKEEISLFYE